MESRSAVAGQFKLGHAGRSTKLIHADPDSKIANVPCPLVLPQLHRPRKDSPGKKTSVPAQYRKLDSRPDNFKTALKIKGPLSDQKLHQAGMDMMLEMNLDLRVTSAIRQTWT